MFLIIFLSTKLRVSSENPLRIKLDHPREIWGLIILVHLTAETSRFLLIIA